MAKIKKDAQKQAELKPESEWEVKAKWKREESLRPIRYVLQCAECRAVIFPQVDSDG